MLRLIAQKLLALVPVLLAVSCLTFLLVSMLPGDPALQVLGSTSVSAEAIKGVREDLGLNDPIWVRYAEWLGNALQGDLGRSYRTSQTVSSAITERLPVTLELMVLALGIALVVAIPLGVLTAYKAESRFDKTVTGVSFGLLSVPPFMLAIFLIFIFSMWLEVLPATGWTKLTIDPAENLRGAIMPALSLAVANIAVFTRLLRTDMVATLQEDHVLLARAKGLPTWRILFRHALRPSSFSLLTVLGIQIGTLIGGSVVVETIFALPGIGRLLIDSIFQRDILIVQGLVLLIATVYVLVNFVVDVVYAFLDPRIRKGAVRRATA